jgi:hypothetical protein
MCLFTFFAMGEARVIGLKLSKNDAELIRHIQACELSNSDLVRKSLEMYFSVVNQNVQENFFSEEKKVNHTHMEKINKMVNHNIRSVNQIYIKEKDNKISNNVTNEKNDELIQHLQEENKWLKQRIEYYEKMVTQYLDTNQNKKPKNPYQKNRSSVRF